MPKFTVELEIKEFKLKIAGSRDQVPQIGQNLSRHLTSLMAPAATPIDGQVLSPAVNVHQKPLPTSGRKSSVKGRKLTPKEEREPVNWTYDGEIYGLPQQGWSTADKAIWLLYVGERAARIAQMSTVQIVNTFNENFRAAKQINQSNVGRDLKKLRLQADPKVDKNDDGWFLTQEGNKTAEELIANLQKPQENA